MQFSAVKEVLQIQIDLVTDIICKVMIQELIMKKLLWLVGVDDVVIVIVDWFIMAHTLISLTKSAMYNLKGK